MHNASTPRLLWRGFLFVCALLWLAIETLWLLVWPKGRYNQLIRKHIAKQVKKQQSVFAFLKALALNPKTTGAILPSSKYLARAMAAQLDLTLDGYVVELGPGTGIITQAILARGIAPKRLIVIEYAAHLAKALKKKFPDITVIQGDAAQLQTLLTAEQRQNIVGIVSGLPLRSLPKATKDGILQAVPKVLSPKGCFVQFTYDIRSKETFYPEHYQLQYSGIIWRNIPPARVGKYHVAVH